MNEFLNLVQGNATVTKYVNRFDGLAKFSFDMVPTMWLVRKGLSRD